MSLNSSCLWQIENPGRQRDHYLTLGPSRLLSFLFSCFSLRLCPVQSGLGLQVSPHTPIEMLSVRAGCQLSCKTDPRRLSLHLLGHPLRIPVDHCLTLMIQEGIWMFLPLSSEGCVPLSDWDYR